MIPKSGRRFSEKIMLHQRLERDDDSKRSHRALKNKPAQIRVLGKIADMLLHVGGIDLHRLA
jgi:hypothetical protein